MADQICPKCGNPLSDIQETPTGKKLQRCSTGFWNKETRKNEGCDYVKWIQDAPVELDEKCPVSEKNFIKLVSGALSISEGSKDYAILESLIIKSEKTATNPKERPIEKRLPAFFRNPKGGKPTKEDLIGILDLIEDS